MARPSKFSQDILSEICERLSKGEPLAVVCRDDHMPTDRTVRNWMDDKDVASAIARAREFGFDALAASCLTIADDQAGDPQRDKLRVDTRLKLLAKWDPKRYGDRMDLNATITRPEEALKDLA